MVILLSSLKNSKKI